MELVLVDFDRDVAEALARAFAPFPAVRVLVGDLLLVAENAIVSPANSQGFMDGGFDRALTAHFGDALERRVRDAIARRSEGYLPVGASIVVPTHDERVPYLIVAPTMLSPEQVEAENAYRAMRAVLRAATQLPSTQQRVFCPGLCTGVGGVDPARAAAEMAAAWDDALRPG